MTILHRALSTINSGFEYYLTLGLIIFLAVHAATFAYSIMAQPSGHRTTLRRYFVFADKHYVITLFAVAYLFYFAMVRKFELPMLSVLLGFAGAIIQDWVVQRNFFDPIPPRKGVMERFGPVPPADPPVF